MLIQKIRHYAVQLFSTSTYATLLKNTSWMMLGEFFSRASRLITLVVLGYCLSATEYGIAMLSIIIHEIVRVFTRVGSGSKIIQCDEKDLSSLSANAITLQWMLCITICVIQIITAPYIAMYYESWQLEQSLKVMALCHLIYPLVTVRVFLVQRQNNMRFFSKANAQSIIIENLSTALFAFLGLGIMSVAFAKICSAIYWVMIFLKAKVTSYAPKFEIKVIKHLINYACKILTSEILKTLRQHIDSLLAARFLSPELFGLYSFAKSAGVGLSMSISGGFLASVYPYLCSQLRSNALTSAVIRTYQIALGIGAVFILQALLAPTYIGLIFGNKWSDSGWLVAILCLSAIPTLLIDVLALSLRAKDAPLKELQLCAYCTFTMLVTLIFIEPSQPMQCAITVTAVSWSWLVIILVSLFKQKFKRRML